MGDSATGRSFLSRFSRLAPWNHQATAVAVAPVPEAPSPKSNGNGHRIIGQKSSLLPQLQGVDPEFFSADGGQTFVTLPGMSSAALAFVAYWYVATRWRAQKIAEAPLMVVAEDQDTGAEEWLSEHDLADVLDEPSPDYDMGELLERTSRYLDDGASALWVIDRDRAGRVARLTPFRASEFEVKPSTDRLYNAFKVTTAAGPVTYPSDRCVYFRDSVEGWTTGGRSRLQVAMDWLRLGETARRTVRDLLENAVWPSLVAIPDASWNPDKDVLAQYQQDLQRYAQPGEKGRAMAMVGGGSVEILTARIKDLVPSEVLDRVESIVAAVSGVPAIVLQFQVGLVNSPWSQMEQARRMAYDDTVQPTWRRMERVLTRQLLRPDDEDRTHFIRFDKSTIAALQIDRAAAALTAATIGDDASLDERRVMVGLEPVDPKLDPEGRAQEIPALRPPAPNPFAPADPNADPDADPNATPGQKSRRRRQRGAAVLSVALRNEARGTWEHVAQMQLAHDATEIERLIVKHLAEVPEAKYATIEAKERGKGRVLSAVLGYLKTTATPAWHRAATPLVTQGAERATAVIAADLGVSYTLLHPHVVKFAHRESAWLVKGITETTRQSVADALAAGLESGQSTAKIARAVAESGGFARSRATLIARTESTRAMTGAPTEALASLGQASGRQFLKTWSGALDDRERDEHVALEGETVGISDTFSNGLQFPSEPNCRCSVLYSEAEAA